jgi:hypothetical protein
MVHPPESTTSDMPIGTIAHNAMVLVACRNDCCIVSQVSQTAFDRVYPGYTSAADVVLGSSHVAPPCRSDCLRPPIKQPKLMYPPLLQHFLGVWQTGDWGHSPLPISGRDTCAFPSGMAISSLRLQLGGFPIDDHIQLYIRRV